MIVIIETNVARGGRAQRIHQHLPECPPKTLLPPTANSDKTTASYTKSTSMHHHHTTIHMDTRKHHTPPPPETQRTIVSIYNRVYTLSFPCKVETRREPGLYDCFYTTFFSTNIYVWIYGYRVQNSSKVYTNAPGRLLIYMHNYDTEIQNSVRLTINNMNIKHRPHTHGERSLNKQKIRVECVYYIYIIVSIRLIPQHFSKIYL